MDKVTPALIHEEYVKLTGYEVRLDINYWTFKEFCEHDYTVEDLRLVIRFIKAQNKDRSPGYKRSLRPSKVIGDLQRFDEDLAEAKAVFRNRPRPLSQRDIALQQLRPEVGERPQQNTSLSLKECFQRIINESENNTQEKTNHSRHDRAGQ